MQNLQLRHGTTSVSYTHLDVYKRQTYADELLYVFYQLGGYVGLNSISVLDSSANEAPDYISVDVSTLY